jgi:hypothetical protein
MPFTIKRIDDFNSYVTSITAYQTRLNAVRGPKRDAAERAAEFSDAYGPQDPAYTRFLAFGSNGTVIGWMVMQLVAGEDANGASLKIDGLGKDPEAARIGPSMIHAAITTSWERGHGGRLILVDKSRGSGTQLYKDMNFTYSDEPAAKMMRHPRAGESREDFSPLWLQVFDSDDGAWRENEPAALGSSM